MYILCIEERSKERGKPMQTYEVESYSKGNQTYYQIRCREDGLPVKLPTKYLEHKTKANCSPNTVKRIAFSLSYYLNFLQEQNLTVGEVCNLSFDRQHSHFSDFLWWLKRGAHREKIKKKLPNHATCNAYLKNVFGWYQFLELTEHQYASLKVLESHIVTFSNSIGVRISAVRKVFRGYFPEDDSIGRTIEQENLLTLLEACRNLRDQVLLLLLAETGFRIGEMLGVWYTQDIDYTKKTIRVSYRTDNQNAARAKNAECRRAKISKETFEILQFYLSQYRDLLKHTDFLFVNVAGKHAGKPLQVNTVYAMLLRLEEKTGIKATPHMLRHYYANERRRSGWDIALIAKALGHRQLSTTWRYLDIGDEELLAASEAYQQKHKGLFPTERLL